MLTTHSCSLGHDSPVDQKILMSVTFGRGWEAITNDLSRLQVGAWYRASGRVNSFYVGHRGLEEALPFSRLQQRYRYPAIGISLGAGQAFTAFVVDRSSIILNGNNGIVAQGASAVIHLGSSTVIGNGSGLITPLGGQILSYQNNQASGNGVDGSRSSRSCRSRECKFRLRPTS